MLTLVIILLLFIFQTATIVIGEFRRPSKAVAWLLVLFIFPIIGFVMYYFLAKEYSQRSKVRRRGLHPPAEQQQRLVQGAPDTGADDLLSELRQVPRLWGLLQHIPGAPLTSRNEVEILTNAETAYTAMLEALERAERHIHFEFYTFRDDGAGRKFGEVLMRKARQGVQVRVICDGIGSHGLSGDYIRELQEAGIELYRFLPPLIAWFDKRMNYRNHRKIIVVDGLSGFVGGINIGDEYLGLDPKLGFWRDTHVRLAGDAVYVLQATFLRDWMFVSGSKLEQESLFPAHSLPVGSPVQMIASGPDACRDAIQEMFFSGIAAAHRRVLMTTPYFIPDPSIAMALKTAAVSGVDVRIILPYKADSRLVQYATRSFLHELMQAGVRFFLYRKGFIHAKVLIIDQVMATVGTANMDMRSFFSNFELNAVMFDSRTIARLEADFLTDLQECEELRLEQFERRSRVEKGKEVLARLLSPLF
ncbi:cardiolipin synthase [Paenibacillus athensensis]|uniref:Cardiolipin synthase n=1 Tax=Paenibacillus athensensis TaxID=1967502 RepID=A0A4Y8Q6I4_9BACL|nr:cardiolipin synthase [Paenibacillus athensensis]MCD1259568.1 cardiolipin synthase [Paenibacillus athensensis]